MSVFVADALLHRRFALLNLGVSAANKLGPRARPCSIPLPAGMPRPPAPPVTLPALLKWIEENEDIELHWSQNARGIRYMWDHGADVGIIVTPCHLQHHPMECVDHLAHEILHHYSLRRNAGGNRWLRGLTSGRNESVAQKMQCAFLLPLNEIVGLTVEEVSDRWHILPHRAECALRLVWEYDTCHQPR